MTPAGRPEIGTPVNVRLGLLTGYVDTYAKAHSVSRARALRAIVEAAFDKLDDDTISDYLS